MSAYAERYEFACKHVAAIRAMPAPGERVMIRANLNGRRGIYPATIERLLVSGRVRVLIEHGGRTFRVVTDRGNLTGRAYTPDPEPAAIEWPEGVDLAATLAQYGDPDIAADIARLLGEPL